MVMLIFISKSLADQSEKDSSINLSEIALLAKQMGKVHVIYFSASDCTWLMGVTMAWMYAWRDTTIFLVRKGPGTTVRKKPRRPFAARLPKPPLAAKSKSGAMGSKPARS